MGSSTGVRHERQEVSSTDNPRVEGSNPATGNFFAEFICSNTILADLPEWTTLGKPRLDLQMTTMHRNIQIWKPFMNSSHNEETVYSLPNTVHSTFIATSNKKAFQLNANRPLSDSPCSTENKFERVGWGGGAGQGSDRDGPLSEQNQHTDMTENVTLPQLRWRTVKTTKRPQTRGFILSQRSQRLRFTGVVSSWNVRRRLIIKRVSI